MIETVAGAVRRFLLQRGVDPDDLRIRANVPVSVRLMASGSVGATISFEEPEIEEETVLVGEDGEPLEEGAEPAEGDPNGAMVEFAVSVRGTARGRGYGARLFAHAVRHARNRSIDRLMIHALSENTAMLRIARHAGAEVRRDGGEAEAWLQLPPHSLASRLEEVLADRASALNYRLTELQGAVACAQLPKLDQVVAARIVGAGAQRHGRAVLPDACGQRLSGLAGV